MYWIDTYADKYQKTQGFEITIIDKDNVKLNAYMSFNQSTRSTYDLAMREATIDGLVTMADISKLKISQIFYKNVAPQELFIIQAINKSEQQPKSKNINAIKQNSSVTVYRKQYNPETRKEEYMPIYEDIISFVSIQHKDEKNFSAGVEENSIYNIQIPRKDIVKDTFYDVKHLDRIILKDLRNSREDKIKIESIDGYGVSGMLRIEGTLDTRTGE